MSRGRPASLRRSYSIEELARLADLDEATVERQLRGLGHKSACWRGSGWGLTDPGWAALLGPGFVDVIAAGGMRAYRELELAVGDRGADLPREPSLEPPRPAPVRPAPVRRSLDQRDRDRIYSTGRASLLHAAAIWGEDIEVVS